MCEPLCEIGQNLLDSLRIVAAFVVVTVGWLHERLHTRARKGEHPLETRKTPPKSTMSSEVFISGAQSFAPRLGCDIHTHTHAQDTLYACLTNLCSIDIMHV